ncbi:MAG: hypothetical protein ABI551_26080, partial [Polyangiaceae bacterium]
MKSIALGALAVLALACGGSDLAPQPVSPTLVTPPANGPLPLLDQDGGTVAAPKPPAAAKPTYPPPRPVTISLASAADDPVDQELKAGDAAFEADDLP